MMITRWNGCRRSMMRIQNDAATPIRQNLKDTLYTCHLFWYVWLRHGRLAMDTTYPYIPKSVKSSRNCWTAFADPDPVTRFFWGRNTFLHSNLHTQTCSLQKQHPSRETFPSKPALATPCKEIPWFCVKLHKSSLICISVAKSMYAHGNT